MSRDGEGGKECRHKYPERGQMRVPTIEGEGGARGERAPRALTSRVSGRCDGDGVAEADRSTINSSLPGSSSPMSAKY